MNKRNLLFWGIASILLSLRVEADPLVVIPQGDLSCSVEITPEQQTPSSSKSDVPGSNQHGVLIMKHMEITQVGNLRREVTTWSDGNTTETWKFPDLGLSLVEALYPEKCIYEVSTGSEMSLQFMRRLLDFDPASVSWITPSALVRKESHNGKMTSYYKATVSVPSGTPGQPPIQVVYQGWIDAKSLAPVAFDDSVYLYELTFKRSAHHILGST